MGRHGRKPPEGFDDQFDNSRARADEKERQRLEKMYHVRDANKQGDGGCSDKAAALVAIGAGIAWAFLEVIDRAL